MQVWASKPFRATEGIHRLGKRGWLRVTVLTVLALIGCLASGFVYLIVNPNALKPIASYVTERFLGRSLIVDGEVTLDLSLSPRISARNLRFGNAAWSATPDMVRAGYAMVQIDLGDLLERRVHLLELDVQDAALVLEDPVDNVPNWSFFEETDGGSVWSFVVEGLTVTDSTIEVRIGELAPTIIEIPTLDERTEPSGQLVLEGNGQLNGDPWRVQGSIGPLEELLAAGHVVLDLDVHLEDVVLQVAGSIDELRSLRGLNLTLRASGTDADVLGEFFRMPAAFADAVELEASIRPDATGHAVDVAGHVSQFELELNGTVQNLVDFDGWDARLHVRGPDASVFGKVLQIRDMPGGPFEIRGSVHRYGGDLDLKDVLITTARAKLTVEADFVDFPSPDRTFARLRLSGEDLGQFRGVLRTPSLPNVPFELDVTLDATGDEVLTSNLRIGDHRLTATGPVGTYPSFKGTRLATRIEGPEVMDVARVGGLPEVISGAYEIDTVLSIDDDGFSASDSRIRIDPYRFLGTIRMPDPRQPTVLAVEGRLDISDLARAGAPMKLTLLPAVPIDVAGRLRSDGSGWYMEGGTGHFMKSSFTVSGRLGTLSSAAGLDLNVMVEGPDIKALFRSALADSEAIPFEVSGRVRGREDAIELAGLVLRTEGEMLNIDGRIAIAPQLVGSRVSLEGQGDSLDLLLPDFPDYHPPHQPWNVSGTVGIPSMNHVEMSSLRLNVGSVEATVSGVVDLLNQEQTNLSLAISGDSFGELGQIRDIVLPVYPFALALELEGSPSIIAIRHLEARWGESDVVAQGSLDLGDRPSVVLRGSSPVLRIDDLQQAIFGELETDTDGSVPDRLIPDVPIPLGELDKWDWDVAIDVGEFHGRRTSMEDVSLVVTVEKGALNLKEMHYRDEYGSFSASGTLEPLPDTPGHAHVVMRITGEDADLGLFTSPDQSPDSVPRYDLDVSITGDGSTVAELAGNLNGTILISSEGGRISSSLLETWGGDFLSNVLEVLNPFAVSEPFIPMQCLVLNAVMENGRLDLEPGFVMRTNRLNMFVLGGVNLRTEKINLSLATQARRGIGISAATITNPYFKIGGTLLEPALQLDAQSAAVAASVAAATAGLSIVVRGIWSRLMGEQNPCPQFLSYQRKSKSKPDSADEAR